MSGWNDGGRGDKGTKRMLQPGRGFFTGEDEEVLGVGENDNLTSVKLGVCDDHAHHAEKDRNEADHHPDWQEGLVHVDLQGHILSTLQR